jgi:3-carboxy-cis,cis-muconate cycloisomerase
MSPILDREYLQALLDVEIALAVAEAEIGVIPDSCVHDIRAAARAENFDMAALVEAAASSGNIVIPLVRKLTEAVAAVNSESARYVHRGATSQDIMDTAAVLRLRSVSELLTAELTRSMRASAALAREHALTPIPGRTWLQQASPTTFGLKAAGWLDMLGRSRERIRESVSRVLVVQLGGAAGTLASLGEDGPAVTDALARQLGLAVPVMPWHAHRDRLAEVAAAFGIACGALGKVGRDVTLLAQSEVAEVFEKPSSRGGSSSMPHKQNPVRAVTAVAAAIRAPGLVATMVAAMPQEHERAAGGWQAEWETMADLVRVTQESASAIADTLGDLQVDRAAMREHLALHGGVAMAEGLTSALMVHLSRTDAMALVERLSRAAIRDRRPLRDLASADPEVSRVLSPAAIERALTPESFLGSAPLFVERVLQQWER